MENNPQEQLKAKNKRLVLGIFGFVIFMIGVSFAAVPLYDLFCRVTGFGGTTQVSQSLPGTISERTVKINFNSDIGRNMPWSFKPAERSVTVNLGQRGITSFIAKNPTDTPVTGTAIYNVTPLKVGKYFNKIQCFCFDEQTLTPNQEMDMPVLFYVDPAMAHDPAMEDVTTITLSYTFFRAESEELDEALENYYNGETGDI